MSSASLRGLRVALLTSLVSFGLVAVSPAAPSSAARPTCHQLHFIPKYDSGRVTVAPSIAQLNTKGFPPAYKRVTTLTVQKNDAYKAGAKIGGSYNTKVGNKLIGQAEVELNMELSASGEWSTGSTDTVTEEISNPTKHNATFVFFRGSTKVTGDVMQSYCKDDVSGGNKYWGHVYWKKVGKWASFDRRDDGAYRCGAGTKNVNKIGKLALKLGCA